MVIGWFPFKIMSDRPILHSEWLQNISISSVVNFIEDAQTQYHAYISATIRAISMQSDSVVIGIYDRIPICLMRCFGFPIFIVTWHDSCFVRFQKYSCHKTNNKIVSLPPDRTLSVAV